MKLTMIFLTGLLGAAMITSCANDANSDDDTMDGTMDETQMTNDSEHPADTDEHPSSDANTDEHPSNASSDENPSDNMNETSVEAEREEIKLALLPPAISEELKTDKYLECKVERAFVYEVDGVKTYEVRVKKGEGSDTFHFNDKGIRVDE